MKTFLLSLLLATFPLWGQAQVFAHYESNDKVDEMVITQHMFKLLSNIDIDESEDDPDLKKFYDLVQHLKEIRVLSTADRQTGAQLKKDAHKLISESALDELMHVKKDGKTIDFFSQPGSSEGRVSRLVMLMTGLDGSSENFIVLSIEGDIDLKTIAKVAGGMDFPGASELKNVNSK